VGVVEIWQKTPVRVWLLEILSHGTRVSEVVQYVSNRGLFCHPC
jgi:hypothetical protein